MTARSREFDEFVATRSGRMQRAAYLLTHNWATAEDLVQTAMAKAWFAWPRLTTDPEAYVRKIMFHTYIMWWRRRWNRENPAGLLPEDAASRGDAHADVDARDELWQALARLPRRQRAVLVLRYYEDLSEAAIAEILECSPGTVKSQASKALAKLRLDTTLLLERTNS
jgi:RNA polymerase sigma-70 factor (sigma-E family)